MTIFSVTKLQEGNFRVPGSFCVDSNSTKVGSLISIQTALSRARTFISQQHPSGQPGNNIRTLISVEELRIVQGYIRPDVMATRTDALQSSRRFQRSSASVRTTVSVR
jgi:hypothetical protein